MKRYIKKGLALTLSALLCLGVLAGCGSSFSATDLVKGNLDLIYLNQYSSEYLDSVNLTKEEADQQYEDGIAVEVENWDEDPEREQTIIHAVIYVARPMHKGMVIGRGGSVLKQVGMENKGYKMPNELSGGEQQRIVIARAILNKPEILLADEPTGNLDVETGRMIVELLREICAQGSAIIMTTHNLNLLGEYPGKVYRCESHRLVPVTEG